MSFWKKSKTELKPELILTERFYDEEEHRGYFKELCPKCNRKVWYELTCHTYVIDGKWKACLPCDSALYLFCETEGCNWAYTWGLNPKNPRFAWEESRRPEWLVGDYE